MEHLAGRRLLYDNSGKGDVTIVGSDRGDTAILEGPAGAEVAIYNNDPTRSSVSYVRGLNLIASVTDGQATYYHYNAHGDVVQLTNATGTVLHDYSYDAFGVERNAAEGDANPFRYCGEQYDAETGNYYLRARTYNPTTGRFTQEDPIRDGLNWYAYCAGNPVMRVDPGGLLWNPVVEFAEWFAGWVNGMYDATAGAAGGLFAETITSPFQDNGSEAFANGNFIGKSTTKFLLTHDIVYDFSVSGGVGNWSGTLGYSFIQGNASGYTAEYIHIGGGYSPGIVPVSGAVGIGFVENATKPEDYAGFFVDGSISGLGGMEYCMWPQGASAMSIAISTNVSTGVRLDHYYLVKSQQSSTVFYDLYKRRMW